MSKRRVTGLSATVIADLVAELGPVWQARRDAELLDRPRRRAVGAGAKYKLVFIDRLLATLVHLRHGVTHDVLACWFQVDRSTITRAVGEIRPLLANRGCRIEGGLRLRTLADIIAYPNLGYPAPPSRPSRSPLPGRSSGSSASHRVVPPVPPTGLASPDRRAELISAFTPGALPLPHAQK
ncbi:helix-turn-helix domain-containing protein [Streptomyces sp. NPDC001770]